MFKNNIIKNKRKTGDFRLGKYKCTRCDWEGPEEECIMVPICPDCTTGHNKLYRIMKHGDSLKCPNCAWDSSDSTYSDPLHEPECPKCRDQYLIVIER